MIQCDSLFKLFWNTVRKLKKNFPKLKKKQLTLENFFSNFIFYFQGIQVLKSKLSDLQTQHQREWHNEAASYDI